jgi:hypothetical protein
VQLLSVKLGTFLANPTSRMTLEFTQQPAQWIPENQLGGITLSRLLRDFMNLYAETLGLSISYIILYIRGQIAS